MDNRLFNIFLLGTAFMVLFTAFQTTGLISQSVLEGMSNGTSGTKFQGSGYTSMAILYSCFSLANILAPTIVSILGPSIAMFIGGVTYFLYVLSYMYPMLWSYYTVAILVGIGAGVIWTAQGVYLASNSDESTISRNSGLFWALFQISNLAGNIYIYITLTTDTITSDTRVPLFIIFSIVAAVGLVIFLFIVWRSLVEKRRNTSNQTDRPKKNILKNINETLKIAANLLKTRNMLLLLIPFAFTGFANSLALNVYGTCIGHYTKYGGDRKRLIGLHGLLVGCGEIVGGGLFGFITKPKTASQRAFIILIGFLLQIIYYYSIFVNTPLDSPIQESIDKPFFDFDSETSQIITFIGSFIIGLGDSSTNTQLMNILSTRYSDCAASAFAIFKFVQSLMSAAAFFYAGVLQLHWQLLIAVVFLFFSTLALFSVLFDEPSDEASQPLLTENVNVNACDDDSQLNT